MQNARLDEAQARNKFAGGNINNLRYEDETTIMAESLEELKCLLMKVKKESDKAGLKLNIQKTKIMILAPITSWQIDGKKIKAMTEFIFLGFKITLNGDCSRDIKRCLLLGRKADKPRQVIKKQRHHFANKVLSGQSNGFSSSHGYECWTIKKAEYRRIGAFKLYCWRRLLSLLDCKEIIPVNPKGNQS